MGCPAGKRGGSFPLCVEGKTGRKSRLSWTGRGGTRQPTHLLTQELLPYVGGHRIPDGDSLWKAKEKRVTLCTCRFPAPLPLPGGSQAADGKCRLRAEVGCSTAPVLAVDPCTFGVGARRTGGTPRCGADLAPPVPPRAGGSLLVGASHAGAHPSDASALCQMLLQDAGPTAALCLYTPPGCPCHKRRHGDAMTAWPVLAAAHCDAGTGSLLPGPAGSAEPSLLSLFFALNAVLLVCL